MIALDLDGTTLQADHTLSEPTRDWLLKARSNGIPFTFATGRHWHGLVEAWVADLGIEVPVVTSNGAEVRRSDGTVLVRRELDGRVVAGLRQLARRLDLHYWGATVDGPVYEADIPEDVERLTWLKFGLHGRSPAAIGEAWRALGNRADVSLSNSDPLNIEINARGATKSTGLAEVCARCGIQPHEVVAIGDSLNDIPMIEFAGLGIAMGNAQPEVKEAADVVTRRCDEHGVAYAVATEVLGCPFDGRPAGFGG